MEVKYYLNKTTMRVNPIARLTSDGLKQSVFHKQI